MTMFGGYGGSGFAGYGLFSHVPVAPAQIQSISQPSGQPEPGERPSSQNPLIASSPAVLQRLAAQRNIIGVHCDGAVLGFDGCDGFAPIRHWPRGDYATYRMMDLDPTLRLVWHQIVARIRANAWTAVAADKTNPPPDAWIDLVKRTVLPLRQRMLIESLRSLRSGWKPFEKVWEFADAGTGHGSEWVCKKLKPYPCEGTTIFSDPNGNFAGISRGGQDQLLAPNKCWIATNDREGLNFYGESRHEGSYDAWQSKQQTAFKRVQAMGKIAGVLPTLYYPDGTTDVNGTAMANSEVAKKILRSLSMQHGVAMQNLTGASDAIANMPSLAGASMWKLEFYNAGNLNGAIEGFIACDEYDDKLLVRGWGRPERSLLEATRGGIGTSDATAHGDSTVNDDEMIEDSIASQMSFDCDGVQGVVDDTLRFNVGENAVGSVRLSPGPLVDEKASFRREIFNSLIVNDDRFRAGLVRSMDMKELLESEDMPVGSEIVDWNKIMAAPATPPPATKGPAGVPVKVNGNGKNGNNRLATQLARYLDESGHDD